jgi:hypothetical protein
MEASKEVAADLIGLRYVPTKPLTLAVGGSGNDYVGCSYGKGDGDGSGFGFSSGNGYGHGVWSNAWHGEGNGIGSGYCNSRGTGRGDAAYDPLSWMVSYGSS